MYFPCLILQVILGQYCCGSLPQWNELHPIGTHHGKSNTHWVVHHLATTSDKHIKMRPLVRQLQLQHAYVKTATQQWVYSTAIANIHQASHCSKSSAGYQSLANEAGLLRPEFADIYLMHPALEIRPFNCIPCLPACWSVYSVNRNRHLL
jgi:hypothetical protein